MKTAEIMDEITEAAVGTGKSVLKYTGPLVGNTRYSRHRRTLIRCQWDVSRVSIDERFLACFGRAAEHLFLPIDAFLAEAGQVYLEPDLL
jgi:hypothetical protein